MKNVIYPIFLEVSSYTTDSFWKFIFKDLSFGHGPYGTYIDKDTICCKFKGKEFNYKFTNKSSHHIFLELVPILKQNLNIRSTIDIANSKDYISCYFENLQPKWTEIKKKSIRNLLIENYVLKVKNNYKLTIKQTKHLLSNIMIAFQFKLISNQDVEYDYQKYEIVKIDGVNINYVRTFCDTFFDELPPFIETEKLSLQSQWYKYIH